jgi:predicted nucleic acid-binding protein
MPICCDTSFLFSLYGNDAHTRNALAEVKRLAEPIHISVLNQYELENALRLSAFRKLFPSTSVLAYLADFEADVASGKLVVAKCNLASVVAEARRLSATHTLKHGARAFDILHVGAAIHMAAHLFLSFDASQRRLARIEGLNVNS